MTSSVSPHRQLLENEYRVWGQIVTDKHGMPLPVPLDEIPNLSDLELQLLVQKLEKLARTPHSG